MKKSAFTFSLPAHLIAHRPAEARTGSRLMILGADGAMVHARFPDLLSLLGAHDLLVFNNTKVMPARIIGRKTTGGAVEILVERLLTPHRVKAQVRTSKSPRDGDQIILEDSSSVYVEGRDGDAFLLRAEEPWVELMHAMGHMPLPPYIDRPDDAEDRERYQTVYAQVVGAVAAPTAGLHFDEALLNRIAQLGVETAELTLHVGAGTFQPVRTEDIVRHQMHAEWLSVTEEVANKVNDTRARGGRVIAVGTTTVRSLETAYNPDLARVEALEGDTDIFLYPGKRFHVTDALVTNFHLPESTLLMLVSAFSGFSRIMSAYQAAVEQEYRFFSYGDAMFLYHNPDASKDVPGDGSMEPGGDREVMR